MNIILKISNSFLLINQYYFGSFEKFNLYLFSPNLFVKAYLAMLFQLNINLKFSIIELLSDYIIPFLTDQYL